MNMFTPSWKLEIRVAGPLDPRRQHAAKIDRVQFPALVALLVVGGSALVAGRFDDPKPTAAVEVAQAEPGKVAAPGEQDSLVTEKVIAALDKPTNVEWQELPLQDAFTYLSDFYSSENHRPSGRRKRRRSRGIS
jgi:hypothetical protein